MVRRNLEIAVGAFIAVGLAALLMLAMQVSNLSALSTSEGYEISARFSNSGGLKVRSPVMMAGVKIGQVTKVSLDPHTFDAIVTMKLEKLHGDLPADTSASIFTAGLLGEQYLSLEPGGDMANLKPGDEIKITQSAIVLEQVIGQVLFSKAAGNDSSKQ